MIQICASIKLWIAAYYALSAALVTAWKLSLKPHRYQGQSVCTGWVLNCSLAVWFMFTVSSLKVGATVSKCFPSKSNLLWACLLLSLGTPVSDYFQLRFCPAAFPAWISSWLILEPHLPVAGNRICGVMLHYPCRFKDSTRAGLGIESFPVFPRKKMGRRVRVWHKPTLG